MQYTNEQRANHIMNRLNLLAVQWGIKDIGGDPRGAQSFTDGIDCVLKRGRRSVVFSDGGFRLVDSGYITLTSSVAGAAEFLAVNAGAENE